MTTPKTVPAWKVINPEPKTMLEHALRYVALGWAVLPLNYVEGGRCSCRNANCAKSAGKHPFAMLAPNGVKNATKDKSIITQWFKDYPKLNLGIACGEISNLVIVDVDPRNGGDETLSIAEAKHGKLPDTIEALTGGGGRHIGFTCPAGKRLKPPGKGVDVQGDGKYIVAPPSVHRTGVTYQWEGSSDPMLGHRIASLPEWLQDGEKAAKPGNLTQITRIGALGFMSEKQIADARAALRFPGAWDVDNYDEWIKVGQALHSTDAVEAFEIWDTWSQTGKNYQPGVMKTHWDSFNAGGGVNIETIFRIAYNAGWNGRGIDDHVAIIVKDEAGEPVVESIEPESKGVSDSILRDDGPPSEILTIPGVLGDLVKEINRTAPKVQPQFAVMAALAIGGVVMARRYRTDKANYTSGYFLAIGESGCGKEYIRKVTQKALKDAGMGRLIGPGGYTSESAILSELIDRPAHISVMDEFGDLMELSAANLNQHKAGTLKMLKELWGMTDGEYMAVAMSKRGLTAEQRKKLQNENVQNPGLALVGLSTSGAFYQGINEKAITGGFLNRINIVETNIGSTLARRSVPEFITPERFIAWCKDTSKCMPGNLTEIDAPFDVVPPLKTIPIDSAALDVFDTCAVWEQDQMAMHRDEGLSEMFARCSEKALKIAATVAGSVDPINPVIGADSAEWACTYVRYYTVQTCISIRRRMGGKFTQWCAEAYRVAAKHPRNGVKRGATTAQIYRESRMLRELEPSKLDQVITSLKVQGCFERQETHEGRGMPRAAWVAVKEYGGKV